MTKGSVREYGLIRTTHHCLWKKQNPWLSNRRSVCQLPILFTAENYPAAKVISKGNPKASSAQRGRFWEQFLAAWISRPYINEEASQRPTRYHEALPKETQHFLNHPWGELLDTNGALNSRRPKLSRTLVGILSEVNNRSHCGRTWKSRLSLKQKGQKRTMWEIGNR